jgi:hypothetical protein
LVGGDSSFQSIADTKLVDEGSPDKRINASFLILGIYPRLRNFTGYKAGNFPENS